MNNTVKIETRRTSKDLIDLKVDYRPQSDVPDNEN